MESFAESSSVLADQKEGLQTLLLALDRFTQVAIRLLEETERGLNEQFTDLRPILRTLVENSGNLRATLETLATFTQYFPETMPGDYLQLDVCQAPEAYYGPGTECPQSIRNDDPDRASNVPSAANGTELILRQPLRGAR